MERCYNSLQTQGPVVADTSVQDDREAEREAFRFKAVRVGLYRLEGVPKPGPSDVFPRCAITLPCPHLAPFAPVCKLPFQVPHALILHSNVTWTL